MDNKKIGKSLSQKVRELEAKYGKNNPRIGMFKDLLINRQTYIQRDLLDQINEETLKQKQTNMSTVTESKPTVVTTQRIKPSEVLTLLKSGYTRYAKDNKGYGSIQEK